jgi:hypothetical protein
MDEQFTVDEIMVQDDAAQVDAGEEKVEKQGDDNPQAKFDKALAPRLQRERDKAYQKAKTDLEAQYAPLKDVERLAKSLYPDKDLREIVIEQEVQKMVKGEGVSEAIARRLIKAEYGITGKAPEVPKAQPKAEEPAVDVSRLQAQAQDIMDEYGVNIVDQLKENPEIFQRVASGEIDMYKARRLLSDPKSPPVVRSPHGNIPPTKGIKDMTPAQLQAMEKRIQAGETFR